MMPIPCTNSASLGDQVCTDGITMPIKKQHLHCRLALLESSVRQPGDPLDLKVIVGRGTHSEGGEATIARATQNRLSALDYKFEPRGGTLLVRPKRQG